jgi:hypothetical protein
MLGGDGTHAEPDCIYTLQALQAAFGLVHARQLDGLIGFDIIADSVTTPG